MKSQLFDHQKRHECITKYVRGNKLRYKVFVEELRRFEASMTHGVQMLRCNRATIDFSEQSGHRVCPDSEHFCYLMLPLHPQFKRCVTASSRNSGETTSHGVNSPTFKKLGLPTFRPIHLNIINNVQEISTVCNQEHLENNRNLKIKTEFKYNIMCMEAYVKQSKELIEDSILFRQFTYHSVSNYILKYSYQTIRMLFSNKVFSAFDPNELNAECELENYLSNHDRVAKEQIRSYLKIICLWCQELVKIDMTDKVIEILNSEWTFCKNNFHYITSCEDLYVESFSLMTCFLFDTLLEKLHRADSQIKQPLVEYVQEEIINSKQMSQQTLRHKLFGVNVRCNELKINIKSLELVYIESLKFSRRFITDLERSAKYNIVSSIQGLLDKLHQHGYVCIELKNLPGRDNNSNNKSRPDFMIFIPIDHVKVSLFNYWA